MPMAYTLIIRPAIQWVIYDLLSVVVSGLLCVGLSAPFDRFFIFRAAQEGIAIPPEPPGAYVFNLLSYT